jgi:hypothetical protein
MQMTVRTAAMLGALLLCAGPGFGQLAATEKAPPKTEPKEKAEKKGVGQSLADLLAEALKNNPDIRVAEAKLQEASAELHRTRLKVTQKIVAAHNSLELQKAQVVVAEGSLKRSLDLRKRAAVSTSELEAAKQQLILEKAKLAALQAELPYLLGKQSLPKGTKAQEARARDLLFYMSTLERAQRAWDEKQSLADWLVRKRVPPRGQSPHGTIAAKLKKALDTPVTLKVENSPLPDVLEFLELKIKGVSFRLVEDKQGELKKESLTLDLKEVPLGAVIQAIQDSIPNLRFAVRDYGVLVTSEKRLPPHAVLVEDFWKSNTGKESAR